MIQASEMLIVFHMLFLTEGNMGDFCKRYDSLIKDPVAFGWGCTISHLLYFILCESFTMFVSNYLLS